MKTFKHSYQLFFLFFLAVAIYTSCSKEDSSERFPPDATESCTDGILNRGEFKIDCGGLYCDSCKLYPSMTAFIDSFWVDDTLRGPGLFKASVIIGVEFLDGIEITGVDTNNGQTISFRHNQAYERGIYIYQDISGSSFGCDFTDGIVEFTAFDPIKQTVSGHFSFNCIGFSSGKKERVLQGEFEDIQYY